jgi:tRNA dimethylallyltransferase
VGKTGVAIEVAKQLHTVILSADSRQCFRELNIGVARPSPEELNSIPHYFIASHSIHQKIDAAFYETYALHLLEKLFQTHQTIVVVGGTGLYIKALTEGLDFIPNIPKSIRENIIHHYQEKGIQWLQEQLRQKDVLFSAEGEMQNPHRMMRALEVIETTGISILKFRTGKKTERNFGIIQVGLDMERNQLYKKINDRVDAMIAAGLEAEAKTLLPHRNLNALQTVGYKEMFDYFDGKITGQQATDLIKQNTRRYAKRQITWFKRQAAMQWFETSAQTDAKTLATAILSVNEEQ